MGKNSNDHGIRTARCQLINMHGSFKLNHLFDVQNSKNQLVDCMMVQGVWKFGLDRSHCHPEWLAMSSETLGTSCGTFHDGVQYLEYNAEEQSLLLELQDPCESYHGCFGLLEWAYPLLSSTKCFIGSTSANARRLMHK